MKVLTAIKKNIEPAICFVLFVVLVCVSARLLPMMGRSEDTFVPASPGNTGGSSQDFIREMRSSTVREESIFKESLAVKPLSHFGSLEKRNIFLKFPAFVPPEVKLPEKKVKKVAKEAEDVVEVKPKGPSLAWTGKVEMLQGIKVFIEDKVTRELFIVQQGDKFGKIYTVGKISDDKVVVTCEGEEDIELKLEKR